MRRKPRIQAESGTRGAGSHLHALVKTWLRIDFWTGCGCKELAAEMDTHPPEWSLEPENFRRIVGKMRAAAKRAPKWRLRLLAHLPGVQYPVRVMVRKAVALAIAERDSQQPENSK
jgi:hypothetical protein